MLDIGQMNKKKRLKHLKIKKKKYNSQYKVSLGPSTHEVIPICIRDFTANSMKILKLVKRILRKLKGGLRLMTQPEENK